MSERKHFNLYYIFLEDKEKHKPPDERKQEALKKFLKNFKKVKTE